MQVKELIQLLQECENQEAPIFLYDQENASIADIIMVDDGFEDHVRVDINF
jgi:hypothetical protein